MNARVFALVFAAACSRASTPAGETMPKTAGVATGAAPTTLDQGTFTFLLNAKPIGEEAFTITSQGETRELRTKTTLRLGDDTVVTEGTLRTDATYHPQSGEFTQIAGPQTRRTTFKRDGDKLVAQSPDQPDATGTGELFAMKSVVTHFGVVCELAGDAEKKIVVFPGSTIVLGPVQSESVQVGDRTVDLRLVPVTGAALIDVYCDGQKPILFDQSGGGFAAVREGYGDLSILVARVPKLPIPAGFEDLPRTVKVEGGELGCSLLVPQKRPKKPAPAVFFLTGSGAQDRDEDTVGRSGVKMSIFRRLAVSLAQAGVVSLRCDDRGIGESTGEGKMPTLELLAGDAAAMAAALRAEKGLVDPAKIGVIGHSEGGIVAPIAAGPAKLRAVVLMGAPGRPLDKILAEQNLKVMQQMGMAEADITKATAHAATIYEAIRAGKPYPADTTDEEKKRVESVRPWLESHLHHDPLAAAAKLTVPVLIAQGGKDFQVSVADAELLRGARKGKAVVYKLYPELSHLFAPVKKGTLADYSDPDLQVDPTFIADVTAFLRKNLGAP